jgi:phage baseplate assembly protein W
MSTAKTLSAYNSKEIIIDSDLQKMFAFEYGDLKLLTNYDAIVQSIWTILNTKKGELVGLVEFGTSLKDYLFEQLTDSMVQNLKTALIADIERWENRVNIIDFKHELNNPIGTLKLDMIFSVKKLGPNQIFRENFLLNSSGESR